MIKVFLLLTPVLFVFQNCGQGFVVDESFSVSSTSVLSAPQVAILAPKANSVIKSGNSLIASCNSSLPVLYYFNDKTNSQTGQCQNGRFSVAIPDTLNDGLVTAYISQTNADLQKGEAVVQFSLDRKAPQLSVLAPQANSTLTQSMTNINGVCETGFNVNISGTALKAATSVICSGGKYSENIVLVSQSGSKEIIVSQTDAAGNSAEVKFNISIQLPANIPVVKITSPAAGLVTNSRDHTLKGTCETGLNVIVTGSGLSIDPGQIYSANCLSGQFSIAIQLTKNDGLKNIVVTQTNSANVSGQDSRSFNLDQTPPALTIASPTALTQTLDNINLSGNCESNLNIQLDGTGVSAQNLNCNSDMYQSVVTLTGALGIKTLKVTQTDAAGNKTEVSRQFELIAPPAANGELLYATHCAACHGTLDLTTKPDRTAAQITKAIIDIPQMAHINISASEAQAIADALSGQVLPPTNTIPTVPLGSVRVPASATNLNKADAFGKVDLRRLTRSEIHYSLLDTTGVDPKNILDTLPSDSIDEAISPFANNSEMQSVTRTHIDKFESFAISYAKLFSNSKINQLAGCTPQKVDDANCFNQFASKVGRLLLRRPIASAELTRYQSLLVHALDENNFYAAPRYLISMFAQHPEFLYRIEQGDSTGTNNLFFLTDYEIATRMSYLIWGSAPDSALLDAAQSGALRNSSQRLAQAQRMLNDNKAIRNFREYHAYWLGYHGISLTPQFANDMVNETNALLDTINFGTNNNSWLDIYSFNQTYVSPALSSHYGLQAISSTNWVQREGGILTHGQFLVQGAKFGDTSPTLRGYRISKFLLCQEFGSVPVGVDTDAEPSGSGASNCKVDRYDMRYNSSCKECHAMTDNIGFGLENYSVTGQFRITEPNQPSCEIDGEGSVGEELITGAGELGQNLANNPVAIQCASKQLLKYTLGRSVSSTDLATIEAMHAQYNETPQLKSMIEAIVSSPAFAHRQGM